MTTHHIARVFAEIGQLLELKGENVFKIRAYERAAQTIRALGEDLAAVRARDGLLDLPGIGKELAAKIGELLDTGKCKAHQELLKEFPPGLLAMMEIPEVGPKSVKFLYDTLGIDSVEKLEAAAQAGHLRDLKGFGAKTEANILKGIERLRKHHERTPLGMAYPLAMEFIARLRKKAPVTQISHAGSLRRMCETIGDLDILVSSNKPAEVMDAFTALDLVEEVIAKGDTKSSIITELGMQVDLRVVPDDSFGAALQYFTGSKQHNIHLREIAVKKGLKLSEWGVFRVKGAKETRIGGKTEQELYDAVGVPMMPPELREDRGEIEAALAGTLPDLITVKDIRGDCHTHTTASDGKSTLAEMAAAAKARGYKYLAICDHSQSARVANGLDAARLRRQIKDIRAFNQQHGDGFTVLAGSEVNILRDGALDFPDDLLDDLDFVVASVHDNFKLDRSVQTTRIVRAMENPRVCVIGHPTGRLIGRRDPYDVDMDYIIAAAKHAGCALELNSFPDRLDLNDAHCRMAKDAGVPFFIDTDAHAVEHFALIDYGIATARRAWLEPRDVLNTRPLPQLQKWIAARRAANPRAKAKR